MSLDPSLLIPNANYSRSKVWQTYFPESELPTGGPWLTGYAQEGNLLFIFANIGTSGRTGHNLPNSFDADNALLTWYGKPKTHSAQPLMRKIILSEIQPMFFVRWDNKDTEFLFLGSPNSILSYEDNSPLPDGDFALKFLFSFGASNETHLEDPGPDGVTLQAMEGSVKSVVVNKFERDPHLRNECTKHFGFKCQICGFDFKDFYGDLGKDFCHVHHITPLSEKKSESLTDPQKDLIPVCANCHSMLHRKKPALTPEQLKSLIRSNNP